MYKHVMYIYMYMYIYTVHVHVHIHVCSTFNIPSTCVYNYTKMDDIITNSTFPST